MTDFSKLPDVAPEYDLRNLMEAGCHFGHQAGDWHPDMDEWIYFQQDGIHIFDLEKTAQQLQKAYNYLYQLGKEGKDVIFVGTKRQAEDYIKEQVAEAEVHWIVSRWLGGLLTNWKQVGKSLRKMIEIEEGLEAGEYEMYTKYEQMQLEKDAQRLARFFDGLRGLKGLPDAIFVIDPERESVAVKEANLTGVPVIAMVDTNTDPNPIDLMIPANDDGRGSIELIVTELAQAYQQGQAEAAGEKLKSKDKSKDKSKKKAKKKAVKKEDLPNPTMSLTRKELNQLAEKEGIENPSSLPRKQAVIDAIKKERKDQ